tara:strand:+ start:280 stop:525 length:246 start_codon:yes stop_codon:yes gene_type:complete
MEYTTFVYGGATDMKYTEMAQREIYNLVSTYVWQLQKGTITLDKFDDKELTEAEQERLVKALAKEVDKLGYKLESIGVVVV